MDYLDWVFCVTSSSRACGKKIVRSRALCKMYFSVSQHFGIDVHNTTSEQKDESPKYNFLDWRLRPSQ